MVTVEDASCSIMMGSPTEVWYDIPSTGLMLCHTKSQEFLQMELITDEVQEMFSRNKRNGNIMRVGYTILDSAEEAGIDENCCLINNQST